ncbi:MAG: glycosyltransferase [Bacteroides sp.]|nr:glycosyltransferase [Bacteroides sp.]
MNKLKLSIIIPVYNVEKYIKETIGSIYRQGIPNEEFEIILINDGSTDQSLSIINDLVSNYDNITVVNQTNQGPSIARNKGIQLARGEYIHFMDSDDVVLDLSLKFMLDTAIKHQLDILKGDYIKANNRKIEKGIKYKPQEIICKLKTGEQGFVEDNDPMYCYIWMHLFKRDFLLNNNLGFINIGCFEDTAFIIHTYLRAQRYMAIPYKFYIYRRHDTSIMSTMNLKKLYNMNVTIQYIQRLSNEMPLSPIGEQKIRFNLFASLKVSLWYLSHHRSLYPHRMEVINDLKKKVPGLYFKGSLKQHLVSFCYTYIPDLYIRIRYLLATKKYD